MIFDLSQSLFDRLTALAEASPRRRMHHNLHRSFAEPCQRLLNAICVDSYIRPHRHTLDPKQECLVCVRGSFGLVTFDDDGNVARRLIMGDSSAGMPLSIGAEIPPGVWHTVVALVPASVLLEVKSGPFDQSAAKELAPWAPKENTPEAAMYLYEMRNLFTRLC